MNSAVQTAAAIPVDWRQLVIDDILSLPDIRDWPDIVAVIDPRSSGAPSEARAAGPSSEKPGSGATPCWEYPRLACEAVGGSHDQARPGMAAAVCLLLSIHVIDDLLDDDPAGLYRRIGSGRAANLALALQAAASRVLERADIRSEQRLAAQACVARAAFATARGQDLDSRVPDEFSEEAYWRVVDAKTPPLFGAALYLGAVLGGADERTAAGLERLGGPIGRLIQASDDLRDAMTTPAEPDWHSRWNNLPILYAFLVEHAEKPRFRHLLGRVSEPRALVEAQEILVRSGALSYCCYQIGDNYRRGLELIDDLPLVDRRPLIELMRSLSEPVRGLFRRYDLEVPESLCI